MEITLQPVPGTTIPDPATSARYLGQALDQLAAFRRTGRLYDRMYEGRPIASDVYVRPELRAEIAPWLAGFRYPLLHLVVDTVTEDEQIESVTTDSDGETKRLASEFKKLRANRRLWKPVLHYKNLYGRAFLHGWTNPRTGRWDAWVETPWTMQEIEENGETVALVRLWEDPVNKIRRANVDLGEGSEARIEKYFAEGTTGSVWKPFTKEDGLRLRPGATLPEGGYRAVAEDQIAAIFDLDANGRVQPLWPLPNPLGRRAGTVFRTSAVAPKSQLHHGIEPYVSLVKSWASANKVIEDVGEPGYVGFTESGSMNYKEGGPRPTAPRPTTTAAAPGATVDQQRAPSALPWRAGAIIRSSFSGLQRVGGESADPILALQQEALLAVGRVTRTSITDLDPAMTEVSGIARREARKPYTKKLNGCKELDEESIADFAELTLMATGPAPAEDLDYTVNWREDEIDITEVWVTTKQQQDAGVPVKQTLIERGYTPEQVEEWDQEAQQRFLDAQQAAGAGAPETVDPRKAAQAGAAAGANQAKLAAVAKGKPDPAAPGSQQDQPAA